VVRETQRKMGAAIGKRTFGLNNVELSDRRGLGYSKGIVMGARTMRIMGML
jgi:hypothetical protein